MDSAVFCLTMKVHLKHLLLIFKRLVFMMVISTILLFPSKDAIAQSSHRHSEIHSEVMDTPHPLEQALEQNEKDLMAIEGVVGVGIGRCDNQDCLIVLLENDIPELRNQIPDQIDGVPVGIEISGSLEIEAQ